MTASQGLHLVRTGDPRRPPVLLLHGFLGSSADWAPLTAFLSKEYYCVAVDLPGHGESVHLAPDDYSMESAVRALADVVKSLSEDAWSVVGYSMGGRVGLHLLFQDDVTFRAAVFSSCSPGIESEEDRAARRTRDEQAAARLESEEIEVFLDTWYRQPIFASLQQKPKILAGLATLRKNNDGRELAKALRGMSVGAHAPLWSRLSQLPCPTLWVAGEEDRAYATMAQRAADLSPRDPVSIVPASGHIVHVEQPERFARDVQSFLDDAQKV